MSNQSTTNLSALFHDLVEKTQSYSDLMTQRRAIREGIQTAIPLEYKLKEPDRVDAQIHQWLQNNQTAPADVSAIIGKHSKNYADIGERVATVGDNLTAANAALGEYMGVERVSLSLSPSSTHSSPEVGYIYLNKADSLKTIPLENFTKEHLETLKGTHIPADSPIWKELESPDAEEKLAKLRKSFSLRLSSPPSIALLHDVMETKHAQLEVFDRLEVKAKELAEALNKEKIEGLSHVDEHQVRRWLNNSTLTPSESIPPAVAKILCDDGKYARLVNATRGLINEYTTALEGSDVSTKALADHMGIDNVRLDDSTTRLSFTKKGLESLYIHTDELTPALLKEYENHPVLKDSTQLWEDLKSPDAENALTKLRERFSVPNHEERVTVLAKANAAQEAKATSKEGSWLKRMGKKFGELHWGTQTAIIGGTVALGGVVAYNLMKKDPSPEADRSAGV